jgi:hypothetical protein
MFFKDDGDAFVNTVFVQLFKSCSEPSNCAMFLQSIFRIVWYFSELRICF